MSRAGIQHRQSQVFASLLGRFPLEWMEPVSIKIILPN